MSNLDYMIEMSNVNKWYGNFHVLKDINLRVKKGVCIRFNPKIPHKIGNRSENKASYLSIITPVSF